MSPHIIAIDQGTTSTRSILFDRQANIIASDQIEHKQIFPKPGWVEHDPLEILNNTRKTMLNVLYKANLSELEISGIGITNQRETTVLWDKTTGIPLSNAIVWQDTRTDQICGDWINSFGLQTIKEKTGLPISTYFSASKIKWLLSNQPEIQQCRDNQNLLFGTMDTWLVWNLTGGPKGGIHVTDVTNASRTMLFNIHKMEWDKDLLENFGIPNEILPSVISSSQYIGDAQLGSFSIPISGILGDQQAALFGQNCFEVGQAKNTYGTGCFILMNTGQTPVASHHGLITTIAYQLENEPPVYCLEGSIAITGALIQWLRDNLKIIRTSSEVEQLARQVEDNGGVYFVPAFSGLFAPYWRTDARGILIGLTQHTSAGHIARAALEATAFQTQAVLESMELDSGNPLDLLKVDGGMSSNDLLMQFQSDILSKKIIRPKVTETTALGAAYAAGISLGVWDGIADLKSNWQEDKIYTPNMEDHIRSEMLSKWNNAVSRTFNWI